MTSNSAVPSDEEARAETEAALLAKQDAEDEARYAAALKREQEKMDEEDRRRRDLEAEHARAEQDAAARSLRGTPRTRRATPRRSPPSSPRWTRRTASASRAVPILRPQMRPRSPEEQRRGR